MPNNNCLFNAALMGAMEGLAGGSSPVSSTPSDYAALCNTAEAIATEVDSRIPFDSLITTASNNSTMLISTTNTIQSNTQMRPQLLSAIVRAFTFGRYSPRAGSSDWDQLAAACVACYTQALTKLVSP